MLPVTTVYTKNNCQPCNATKRKLKLEGVAFVEINVDDSSEARDYLVAGGWRESPVVEASDGSSWSGYQPDRIMAVGAFERAV